jgi:DNA-binding MarR family transcriptional regulator
MVNDPEKEHTSKPASESQFLPPLQKSILLCLARNQPLNKNQTAHAAKKEYKASWNALKSLENKGLITEINTGEYRGREYTRYWLTPAGVFIALIEGIKPETLLAKTLKIYPENKTLQCIIEASSVLGTDMYKIAYPAILSKRKLEKDDVALMMAAQLRKNLSWEQIRGLILIMKKYPEQFGNFNKQREQMLENLKKVESILKNV